MKKLLLTIFVALSLTVVGASFAPEAQTAFAAPKDDVCAGIATTGAGSGCTQSGTTVESVIKAVIVILSWVVGVVSVIMIIVGGFKYITSGGDSGNVQSAKNTIIYALVGLIVVALAQVLVAFVLNKVIDGSK
jgi:hypothetical protein